MSEVEGEQKVLTAKEIKKIAKPEFAASPEKFYPVETMKKFGFSRANCSKCGNNYWRHSEKRDTCGDSACVGSYTFIGQKSGLGKDHHVTYTEAWQTLKTSLEGARVPHTAIPRYPVVARWRNDVDYVAAGIFCFQPFCVTGELEPPANPLCCPQFCLRFNDLDSIGITGRHYSGFVMLGIQVFNKPDNYKYFKDECVEFNLNWLIDGLKLDPDEITLIEDVWAGGGNLGPSIEYFVHGLELGNMVFMQYKTFPDGSRQELQVKVIDVGIGLERIPWLLNGTPTSYADVFPRALASLEKRIGRKPTNAMWEKFGPLSCILNADEVENMDQAWDEIAKRLGVETAALKGDVQPVRDMYIIADHTRTCMIAIEDGSLPSNVGGASNLRGVLRKVFALLHKNKWWDAVGIEGLMEMFDCHRKDLEGIYGEFKPYPSFREIIEMEYQRWQTTDVESKKKVEALHKKKKGKFEIKDWLQAMTSYGLDAEKISEYINEEIPGQLYAVKAAEEERASAKAALRQLYDTVHLAPTDELFYNHGQSWEFEGKVLAVFPNVQQENKPNIVILDKSNFYPLGGGQENDKGTMIIDGEKFAVVDVTKVGKCILHTLDRPVNDPRGLIGKTVSGVVDSGRREALRNHHTATHIMSAACRKVLGPHVWQNGAKKSEHGAHLDITHFRGISREEEVRIENECNLIIRSGVDVHKSEMPKEEAEKKYGFSLYQGGVVPGSTLRIVDIDGVDQEACCGTHCDNVAEVGFVRILKSNRISDGIVRIQFVAGDAAIAQTNADAKILSDLQDIWAVQPQELVATADRFFKGYKVAQKQSVQIYELQIKVAILELLSSPASVVFVETDAESPTPFISNCAQWSQKLVDAKKGIVFIGDGFAYGLLGDASLLDVDSIEKAAREEHAKAPEGKKAPSVIRKTPVDVKVGKTTTKVPALQFHALSLPSASPVTAALNAVKAAKIVP